MFFAITINSSKAAAENVNTMFPFLYSRKTLNSRSDASFLFIIALFLSSS